MEKIVKKSREKNLWEKLVREAERESKRKVVREDKGAGSERKWQEKVEERK